MSRPAQERRAAHKMENSDDLQRLVNSTCFEAVPVFGVVATQQRNGVGSRTGKEGARL